MFEHAASYIPVGLLVLSALGLATGYYRANRDNATNKYLAEAVRARDLKISDQEKEVAALTATNEQKDQQISELKTHNKYLQSLVKGSPEITELKTEVANLRAVLMRSFKLKLDEGEQSLNDKN